MTQQNSPQTIEAVAPEEHYVVVLKIGGNELDDDTFLYGLAKSVQSLLAGGKQPVIMAGPCSVESEQQIEKIAMHLYKKLLTV